MPCARRQSGEAGFEHLEEGLALDHGLRISPDIFWRRPAVFGIEQRVEAGDIEFGVQILAWRRHKSPALAQHIDDLVAQDGEQPSLDARFAAEATDAFERGKQRLLGGVVGRGLVADLQQSEPIEGRPVARDFLGEQKGRARHRK